MYYATGMPGWMRFGYSPGWGGIPPGQAPYPGHGPDMAYDNPEYQPPPGPWMTKEQELGFLKNQAEFLKKQLEQIDTRIQKLEQEEP
jgi:hypothetical protein